MGAVDITNRALQAIGTRSTISSMSEGSNESNNANLCYASTRQELIRAAPWNFCTATANLALLKSAPGTIENPSNPELGTSGVRQPIPSNPANLAWNQATQPPPGWLYEYAYPQDCLQARKVVPNTLLNATSSVGIFPSGLGATTAGLFGFWERPGVRFQVATDLDPNANPFTCILTNLDQAIICYLRDIAVEDVWDSLFQEAMVQALAGKLALALTSDKGLADRAFKRANDKIMMARAADGNEGVTVVDNMPDWITQGHGFSRHGYASTSVAGFSLPYGSLFGGY